MKRERLRGVVMGLAFALGAANVAHADTPPDVWSRARDPAKKSNFELHRQVQKLLFRRTLAPDPFFMGGDELQVHRARDLLEQAKAEERGDPQLLFDLGHVYRDDRVKQYEAARRVLEKAIALAPEHPAAEQGWWDLALSYSKLDRAADEKRAYQAYLQRVTSLNGRATALLNLAESEMRLDHLSESILAYREAKVFASATPRASDSYILAQWGLVVALDRYGDTTASQHEADEAVRLDPDDHRIGDPVNVFFVPAYERSWYLGLGAAARARKAADARTALRHAQLAEKHFLDYVSSATADDRWKGLAEKHLASAKKERLRLEARVRALPRVPRAQLNPEAF